MKLGIGVRPLENCMDSKRGFVFGMDIVENQDEVGNAKLNIDAEVEQEFDTNDDSEEMDAEERTAP